MSNPKSQKKVSGLSHNGSAPRIEVDAVTIHRLISLPQIMVALRYDAPETAFESNLEMFLKDKSGFGVDPGRYLLFRIFFARDLVAHIPELMKFEREGVVSHYEGGDFVSDVSRDVLRCSPPAHLSHLGIAGKFIQELNREVVNLNVEDFKLYSSHHEEPSALVLRPLLFLVECLGGGFLDADPEAKVIRLWGHSTTFGGNAGVCRHAESVICSFMTETRVEGFETKIG